MIYFNRIKIRNIFLTAYILIFIFTSCNRNLDIIEDTTVSLTPPQNLRVLFSKDGAVSIRWDRSSESIIGYNIYISASGVNDPYQKINNTTSDYYYIKNLLYTKLYYFYVTSYSLGGESDPSNIVSANPVNSAPPSSPTGLLVLGNYTLNRPMVNLTWNPNPEGDINHYNVYRYSPGSITRLITRTQNNNYTDTINIDIGIRYYYFLLAIDNGDLESASSITDNDIILDKPVLVSPLNRETISKAPTLKWNPVKGANSYLISLSTALNGNEVWLSVVYSSDLSDYKVIVPVTVLSYGNTYYWKIFAISKSTSYLNSCSEIRSFYFFPE